MKAQPLVRVLTDAGYGSRRKVAGMVKSGAVQVNGEPASSFMQPVDIDRDSVTVSGKQVGLFKPQRIYLMLHKPPGILSTTEDDRGRPTVMDLLPEKYAQAGLYPAGRLDEDSTGLLVLTNDGDLTHELTHPRYEHEKEYHVTVTKPLADEDFRRLAEGIEIEGQLTWPARVHAVREDEDDQAYTYSITIHEGRKRQVRRMLQALGKDVTSLVRVRMGSLMLGSLAEGEYRELNDKELKSLMRKATAPSTSPSRSAAGRGTGARQQGRPAGPTRPRRQEGSKPQSRSPEERTRDQEPVRQRRYSPPDAAERGRQPEGQRRHPTPADTERGRQPERQRRYHPPTAAERDPRPARRRDTAAPPAGANRRTVSRPGQARFSGGPPTGGAGRSERTARRPAPHRQRRVTGTSMAPDGFEGGGSPRRRPTADERPRTRTARAQGKPRTRSDKPANRPEHPPRPRGQVSRQRPGASQRRPRQERGGPSRPRRT